MDLQSQHSKRVFACLHCEKQFSSQTRFKRHFLKDHGLQEEDSSSAQCKHCQRIYKYSLNHIMKFHSKTKHSCRTCSVQCSTFEDLLAHVREVHSLPVITEFHEVESVFSRRLQTFRTECDSFEHTTLESAFEAKRESIVELLQIQLKLKFLMRYSLITFGRYERDDELGHVAETIIAPFRSSSHKIFMAHTEKDIRRVVSKSMDECARNEEQFRLRGSGWRLRDIVALNVEVGKISMHGGCSSHKLLQKIPRHKRKYVTDIKSTKQNCFFNCVALALLTPEERALRANKKNLIMRQIIRLRLKKSGMSTPVSVTKIKKFESKNAHLNAAINVFTIVEKEIVPVYQSKYSQAKHKINLLLISRKNDHHYVVIDDLNSMCLKKGDVKRGFHCFECMAAFSTEGSLKTHESLCSKSASVKIDFPKENSEVKFTATSKTVLQPIIGVLDFESSLQKVSRLDNAVKYGCTACLYDEDEESCTHNTSDVHYQIPSTYSITFADMNGKILYSKTESSDTNLMQLFFATIHEVKSVIFPLLQQHKYKSDYTEEEEKRFQEAGVCYLCKEVFGTSKQLCKVRDHCHYSSAYLGAAHNECNIQRRFQGKVPIYIHNFRNYDSHFILKALEYSDKKLLSGIPYNMEKFRTLTLGKLTFVDSLELLPASLADLVNNLQKSNHDFSFLEQLPYCTTDDHKQLLLRKGVYPYEWAESVDKLEKTKHFPAKDDFYSLLNQAGIKDEDYDHGKKVFDFFKCQNMLEYCELYCELDTILLLEVISNFRSIIFKEFGLDSTHYISNPQLAFDCMLKTLPRPIVRMHDPDMILMCEQNIRGGVSYINDRHVDLKDYSTDEDCVQDHLLYTDANNLYSVAQSQYMPIGGYRWCETNEIEDLHSNILSISKESSIGYILNVELEYPPQLHDLHASMPLAPEQMDLDFEMLSPYAQSCLNILKGEARAACYKSQKLCSTLGNKKNYTVHYRNLQTYLRHGLILKKINRAFQFEQAPYIKAFIEMCTKKRAAAKTTTEKNIWKLLMNSVYGKFLQDNRKHFNAKICTKARQFDKYYSSPFYKGHKILSEHVVVVYLSKEIVKLDRLYATGFSILELSKNHMYQLWYDFIQPRLGADNVSLVLTDTDSLLLHVQNYTKKNLMNTLHPIMDYSNYPINHHLFSDVKKAKPGYLKNENGANIMTEVIGLRSKCYATSVREVNTQHTTTSVVCKGVGKRARESLTMSTYRECITTAREIKTSMYCIRSKNHDLFTQKIRKIALSTFDDKRQILQCGKHSIPHDYRGNNNNNGNCFKCQRLRG